MATIVSYTADRIAELLNNTVIGGMLNDDGDLLLMTQGGMEVQAGNVRSSLVLDSRNYGIAGDGVTNDTVALRNALVDASEKDMALALVGNVGVFEPIVIPENVKVLGGKITSLAPMPRTITLGTNSILEGVTVDGNQQVVSYIVDAGTSSKATILGGKITGGLTCQGLEVGLTASDITVKNVFFDGLSTGIRIRQFSKHTKIIGNQFSNWFDRCVYILGTDADAPSFILIGGNKFNPAFTTLRVDPGPSIRQPIQTLGHDTNLIRGIVIIKNTVIGNDTSHADTGGVLGSADLISVHRSKQVVIDGNVLYGSGDVGITVSQQCEGVAITNNLIERADSVGICVGSSNSVDTTSVVVSNNVIRDANMNRANDGVERAKAAVMVNRGKRIVVTNNISVPSVKTKYGLAIVDVTDIRVANNDWGGHSGGDFYYEGTNTDVKLDFIPVSAVKTAASPSRPSSTTRLPDPDLVLPVVANAVYEFELYLPYLTAEAADLSISWSVPAGTTMSWTANGPVSSTLTPNGSITRGHLSESNNASLGGNAAPLVAIPKGMISTGATAGSIQLNWAQLTSDPGDTIVRALAKLKLVRIK